MSSSQPPRPFNPYRQPSASALSSQHIIDTTTTPRDTSPSPNSYTTCTIQTRTGNNPSPYDGPTSDTGGRPGLGSRSSSNYEAASEEARAAQRAAYEASSNAARVKASHGDSAIPGAPRSASPTTYDGTTSSSDPFNTDTSTAENSAQKNLEEQRGRSTFAGWQPRLDRTMSWDAQELKHALQMRSVHSGTPDCVGEMGFSEAGAAGK
jgi:hypothetical protein